MAVERRKDVLDHPDTKRGATKVTRPPLASRLLLTHFRLPSDSLRHHALCVSLSHHNRLPQPHQTLTSAIAVVSGQPRALGCSHSVGFRLGRDCLCDLGGGGGLALPWLFAP